MMSNKKRVLLADDHAVVRNGFRMILNAQDDMEVVGEAANGREAVEACTLLQPDRYCIAKQDRAAIWNQ